MSPPLASANSVRSFRRLAHFIVSKKDGWEGWPKIAAVSQLGDNVTGAHVQCSDTEAGHDKAWDDAERSMDIICAKMPCSVVSGNHDLGRNKIAASPADCNWDGDQIGLLKCGISRFLKRFGEDF